MVVAKRRRSAGEWRQLVDAWVLSRATAVAFGRRRGVSANSLRWWRWEFRRRDRLPVVCPEVSRFVEISPVVRPVVRTEVVAPVQVTKGSGIEIVVGKGRRIRIAVGFDSPTLRQVLDVTEEPRC